MGQGEAFGQINSGVSDKILARMLRPYDGLVGVDTIDEIMTNHATYFIAQDRATDVPLSP